MLSTRKSSPLLVDLSLHVGSLIFDLSRPDPSTGKTVEAFAKKAMTAPPSTIPMNGTVNGTTNAGTSQTAAAPAPSNSKFAGAANNLVAMGLTTFAGIAIACFM